MIYKVLWAVISVKKRTVHANSSTEIGKSSKLSTERECRKGSWFKDRDFRKEQFTVCRKIDFNKDWICRCLTRDEAAYPVTLPHDAMLSEPRTQESTGEGNIGWYIGGDYEYTKNFFVPEEYKDKKVPH